MSNKPKPSDVLDTPVLESFLQALEALHLVADRLATIVASRSVDGNVKLAQSIADVLRQQTKSLREMERLFEESREKIERYRHLAFHLLSTVEPSHAQELCANYGLDYVWEKVLREQKGEQ